jgi:hypothetical protein
MTDDAEKRITPMHHFDTPSVHLRKLLEEGFSDEALTHFCFDAFRPVHGQFSTGMSRPEKIQRLIEYVEQHGEVPHLLDLVRQSHPHALARFEQTMIVPLQAAPPTTLDSAVRRGWWNSTWWVQWIAATSIGWAIGTGGVEWLLVEAVGWPVFKDIYDALYTASGTVAYHALSGLMVGVIVGIAQGLLLYRRIPGAFWWVTASTIGWGVGWAVGGAVADAAFYHVIIGAVGGAFAGIAQWQVLQRHLPGTGGWVLVSAIGWAAGRAVDDFLFGLVNGAIAGAISGLVLLWLLRCAPSRSQATESSDK